MDLLPSERKVLTANHDTATLTVTNYRILVEQTEGGTQSVFLDQIESLSFQRVHHVNLLWLAVLFLLPGWWFAFRGYMDDQQAMAQGGYVLIAAAVIFVIAYLFSRGISVCARCSSGEVVALARQTGFAADKRQAQDMINRITNARLRREWDQMPPEQP
jgi:hypothetical protein